MGRIFPPLEHRIFPSYWQPPIVETQYITDSIRKDLIKPNFVVESVSPSEMYKFSVKAYIKEDASVDWTTPNSNNGSSTQIWWDDATNVSGGYDYAYLKIPMPSLPSITSAKLYLYKTTANNAKTLVVFRVDGSWSESTITLNNAPPRTYKFTTTTSTGGGFWFSVDIFPIVQDWIGGRPNYGIAIGADGYAGEPRFDCSSREGIYPPYVVFEGTL